MGFSNPTEEVSKIPQDVKKEKQIKEYKEKITMYASALEKIEEEHTKKQKQEEKILGAVVSIEEKTKELDEINAKVMEGMKNLQELQQKNLVYSDLTDRIAKAKVELDILLKKQKELSGLDKNIEEKASLFNLMRESYELRTKELEDFKSNSELEINSITEIIKISNKAMKEINSELIAKKKESDELKEIISSDTISRNSLRNEIVQMEDILVEKEKKAKEKLAHELSSMKEKVDKECAKKYEELNKKEVEVNEKIKWQEDDRKYLREVKSDLEGTYKIKIKRVI